MLCGKMSLSIASIMKRRKYQLRETNTVSPIFQFGMRSDKCNLLLQDICFLYFVTSHLPGVTNILNQFFLHPSPHSLFSPDFSYTFDSSYLLLAQASFNGGTLRPNRHYLHRHSTQTPLGNFNRIFLCIVQSNFSKVFFNFSVFGSHLYHP